jgi:urease accessory protein
MEEEYLLLLLSDSNLPTGGFVASSGLESFIQHGYLTTTTTTITTDGSNSNEREKGLVEFIKMSLNNYQKLNEFIVEKSWKLVQDYKKQLNNDKGKSKEVVMDELLKIDLLCESMILNQISKRSSLAQGNALLSLYDRALSPPSPSAGNVIGELVRDIRKETRKGVGLEGEGSESRGWKGHQSTSFGIVMAAVGLSLSMLGLSLSVSHPSDSGS